MARRKGRILAFQALFSWDMGSSNVNDLVAFPWVAKSNELSEDAEANVSETTDETVTFARLLVAGTIEHIAEIDALIKKHLDSWDFERINKVDLAVLRISVYPLLYQSDDIHPSIIINEAIDISKEYGPGDTYKFVNAVLDNIRKEISR